MRRYSRHPERDDPAEIERVMKLDDGCIAAQLDPTHTCEGRWTLEHVPERGQNGLGQKGKLLTTLCLKANSVENWGERHREVERLWIEARELRRALRIGALELARVRIGEWNPKTKPDGTAMTEEEEAEEYEREWLAEVGL